MQDELSREEVGLRIYLDNWTLRWNWRSVLRWLRCDRHAGLERCHTLRYSIGQNELLAQLNIGASLGYFDSYRRIYHKYKPRALIIPQQKHTKKAKINITGWQFGDLMEAWGMAWRWFKDWRLPTARGLEKKKTEKIELSKNENRRRWIRERLNKCLTISWSAPQSSETAESSSIGVSICSSIHFIQTKKNKLN